MNRYQTVKQLREILAGLPDDMVILKESGDHEYCGAYLGVGDVHDNGNARARAGDRFAQCDENGNTNAKAVVVA